MSQIISSCNFLCDNSYETELSVPNDLDKFLSRREKYIYENILAEVQHVGSLKRTNAALVILQKVMKNQTLEYIKSL